MCNSKLSNRSGPLKGLSRQALLALAFASVFVLNLPGTASAQNNTFCGGATHPTVPSDLANVKGDMTIEATADQPANIVTCSKGYMAAKCGDFDTANKIFDKCIAAGYVGAMIWKALMYEDGTGVPQDSAKATQLMKAAALKGNDGYATIAKVHYASALLEGKGIEKNEKEAMKWFQTAAAEGDRDAKEFLETGHHTADRDQHGVGVGTPTESVAGQKFTQVIPAAAKQPATWFGLVIVAIIAIGAYRQSRRKPVSEARLIKEVA